MTISAIFFLSILTTGFRDVLSFLHRYIRETDHAPWWPCFLMDQICVSNFCRSPSDHFCRIILNSDKWFQSRKILNLSLVMMSHHPGSHVF